MENGKTLAAARARYRALRAAVCAQTGWTSALFDRRASEIGTQDGEGEPATAADYMQGALEIAADRGVAL